MNLKSLAFVKKMFGDYYAHLYSPSDSLSMMDQREFGFSLFEGWMKRHQSFQNHNELRAFLQSSVPSDAYCSCAYYADPEAEMDQKGWLGADLIFDIDADHVPSSCDKVHDNWVCGVCGLKGKGYIPEQCPVCGDEKFEGKTWPCEVCLNSAKTETVKLLNMLLEDFGFSKREVGVFFSGHRGYHVYVESDIVKTLGSMARKEIVDYISGLGLAVFFHGLNKRNIRKAWSSQGSPLLKFGWGKRILLGMRDFMLRAKAEDLAELGLKKNIAETILQNKPIILKKWLNEGTWSPVRGIGFKTWKKISEHVAKQQSAEIDTVVTTDIHRLIRLSGTLHSKTGFKKVEFPVTAIDDFDPFKSAVAFKTGTVTVFVKDAPQFRVKDDVYGPYHEQIVELPKAAALLLVCKDRGEVLT